MKPNEYVKTITYNSHMINIGLDEAGQQYFLEYIDKNGKLIKQGCGTYNHDYQFEIERLFGEPKCCVLYQACSKDVSVCHQHHSHGYCIQCPYNGLFALHNKQSEFEAL